jgi:plastocyanin
MAVHASVHDQSGRPLRDAVVTATPRERHLPPAEGSPKAALVIENFAFSPPVFPVRVGTAVTFQNRDDIRHHIYSISAARNFELFTNRLSASPAVVFDKPGVVVLGSATDDRMIGHVCVLETPYFASTGADGSALLEGLPRGSYLVRVWHPDMKVPAEATTQRVSDTASHRAGVDFRIPVQQGQPSGRQAPPPAAPRGGSP